MAWARRLLRRPRIVWRLAGMAWKRSLQLRVVAVTATLSALALGATGLFLSQQIATGLFDERFRQVETEAVSGLNNVKATFDSLEATDPDQVKTDVTDTLQSVEGDGVNVQRLFVLDPLPADDNPYVSAIASPGLTTSVVPVELDQAVREGPGVYWESMSYVKDNVEVPGLAFGTRVSLPPGRDYGLYLIYDLSSVQETLGFFHRTVGLAGALLLAVIGIIAWYTTRLVVRPVSTAAAASERLASGHLEQRMEVSGEDELARLGISFNHMAGNLQDQIVQLATLSQMQQRFVSDVSHELRTPLTTVAMAAEVLHDARGSFDPINQRSAELLYNEVERFQSLLNDLLEISRFDAGAAALDADDFDMMPVVNRVLDTARPHSEQLGSELRIHNEGTCIVEMDPRRIERVIRNLVMNAVEHSEGQPIDVYIAGNDSAVSVAVRDHGVGMTKEQAQRVFDRFWRADPARARTTGGSGLGLSIATEDTRLHGGHLDAWGEVGKGACFRLTLPRRVGADIKEPPLALPPDEPAPSTHEGVST
ncbi:MtrAB system histidine kinase MtrB [Zhihengliuella halotolerans]|uniref:MtrAB system histidine kinase MtrB n=1 Tax=Zhihengliuella halotolerans TaxID=370736 RepID=UPI000C8092E0|nr:MtrAB system histidine kinase MtrB [Zhihengliuella halotolerans]